MRLTFYKRKDFNTSHVTVYHCFHVIFTKSKQFQYIPCYGLSDHPDQRRSVKPNFNTSHVTVYLCSNFSFRHDRFYFNTSHVTVYLECYGTSEKEEHISIHPMLRFIPSVYCFCTLLPLFQYIPCYGLSETHVY